MLDSSDESDLELLNLLSDLDSEDEETHYNKNRVNYIKLYEDHEFTYIFRLTKTVVEDLLLEIYPHLRVTSRRNNGTSPLHQLLLTLRYYALGAMLESVADFIGVSKSSASRIVKDVSAAITKLSSKYLYIHSRTQEDFYTIARFPRVLGVIDGTHIFMHSPESNFGQDSRIKISITSMNVQAVCDAHLRFMNIIAGWSGTIHDATIFLKSKLRAHCENGAYGDRWLLGDSAYPCKPYLLTPVINPKNCNDERYNLAHAHTRQTLERCFKAWKRRFPILYTKIRLSLENTQTLIIATAILHNICRQHDIEDMEPEVEIPDFKVNFMPSDIPESSALNQDQARQSLINSYFTS